MSEIAKKAFNGSASTVVLASGKNWPDTLAASALAGAKGCPLLLTDPDGLSEQTASLLQYFGTDTVWIVGGTSAVSGNIDAALIRGNIFKDNIHRLSGADRTQTAELIEAEVTASAGTDTCIICSGSNFPDALSVSSYACANKLPILLTGADGKLTAGSLAIARTFRNAIIIGKEGAVSGDAETQLAGLSVKRIGGDDRCGTSLEVIRELYGGKVSSLCLATGENYPDALAGATLAGTAGGAILLLAGTGSTPSAEQLSLIRNTPTELILGGEQAISAGMKEAIEAALK